MRQGYGHLKNDNSYVAFDLVSLDETKGEQVVNQIGTMFHRDGKL